MLVKVELRALLLLLFADKQDLPSAMIVVKVSEAVGLGVRTRRRWHLRPFRCDASCEGGGRWGHRNDF